MKYINNIVIQITMSSESFKPPKTVHGQSSSLKINIAIVGSRNATLRDHYNFIESTCSLIINSFILIGYEVTIISGGASGVDKLAERFALSHKYKKKIYNANWSKYGKAAGPIRNKEIIENSHVVIAFPDKNSVGTFDTITRAKSKKIPVHTYMITI